MATYQGSLLEPSDVLGGAHFARTELGAGAWVDICRGWLAAPSALATSLTERAAWKSERRAMYDRLVDIPRLAAFYDEHDPLPDPELGPMRSRLNEHYDGELASRPFATVGLCLYRDERDSVAWHGDRIGRGASADTVVAICSVGASRRFQLRRRGGGRSIGYELDAGDLLVMGGSCQRTFDHAVPKSTSPRGARISIQFRPSGVR